MGSDSSRMPHWLRFAFIGLGIAALLWFPIEDTALIIPLGLGVTGGLLLGAALYYRRPNDPTRRKRALYPLIGAALGFGIPVLVVFLMILKSGLHAHGFPDFTVGELEGVLRAAPVTAIPGFVAGLLVAAWDRKQN